MCVAHDEVFDEDDVFCIDVVVTHHILDRHACTDDVVQQRKRPLFVRNEQVRCRQSATCVRLLAHTVNEVVESMTQNTMPKVVAQACDLAAHNFFVSDFQLWLTLLKMLGELACQVTNAKRVFESVVRC